MMPTGLFRRQQGGIFLLSASVLSFQIVLTRLFSVVFAYHYTFLGLSLALLGLGLGCALAVIRPLRDAPAAPFAGMYGLAGVFTLFAIIGTPGMSAQVPLLSVVATLPFLFAGIYYALVFRRNPLVAARLYGSSLLGSAAGCAVVFPLLSAAGGEGTLLAASLLGASAAFISARGGDKGPRSKAFRSAGLLACAITALTLLAELTWHPFPRVQIGGGSGKEFVTAQENYETEILDSRWSGFARTDLVRVREFPDQLIFYTDGSAPAPMLLADDEAVDRFVSTFVGRAAFQVRPADRVLAIGSGGGRDVELALKMGARSVTAVEVNPDMVELVREYASFNGGIYDRPGVRLEVREGRSFLRQDGGRYDLIMVSLPRSQRSANLAGYELVENYLLTREAMEEYLAHTREGGIVAVVAYGDADMLRLFGILMTILKDRGVNESDAMRHVMILSQPNDLGVMRYLFMAKEEPFSEAERSIARRMHDEGQVELEYLPGVPTSTVISNLVLQVDDPTVGIVTWIRRLSEVQNVDFSLPTDDRPFFYKWERGVPSNLLILLILTVVPAVSFLLVAVFLRSSDRTHQFSPVYFALLGAGYIMLEVALVHKASFFLGVPAYSLAGTLAGLLGGGGIGSTVVGSRLAGSLRRQWYAPCAVVVLALVSWGLLSLLFDSMLGLGLWARFGIVVTIMAVIGFVMGIPFPVGLERLGRTQGEEKIPWAWAANGVFSVTGSVLTVVLAVTVGFSAVFPAAAVVYGLAALTIRFVGQRK